MNKLRTRAVASEDFGPAMDAFIEASNKIYQSQPDSRISRIFRRTFDHAGLSALLPEVPAQNH